MLIRFTGENFLAFHQRIPEAIQRAKQLGGCDPGANNFPIRICTSVYQLFEYLLHDIHQKKEFL